MLPNPGLFSFVIFVEDDAHLPYFSQRATISKDLCFSLQIRRRGCRITGVIKTYVKVMLGMEIP